MIIYYHLVFHFLYPTMHSMHTMHQAKWKKFVQLVVGDKIRTVWWLVTCCRHQLPYIRGHSEIHKIIWWSFPPCNHITMLLCHYIMFVCHHLLSYPSFFFHILMEDYLFCSDRSSGNTYPLQDRLPQAFCILQLVCICRSTGKWKHFEWLANHNINVQIWVKSIFAQFEYR